MGAELRIGHTKSFVMRSVSSSRRVRSGRTRSRGRGLVRASGPRRIRGYLYRAVPHPVYGGSEKETGSRAAEDIREDLQCGSTPAALRVSARWMVVHGTGKGASGPRRVAIDEVRRQTTLSMGDIVWCQGYSEPGRRSDRASDIDFGGFWRWRGGSSTVRRCGNTGAPLGFKGFALVRTEPAADSQMDGSVLPSDRLLKQRGGSRCDHFAQIDGGDRFNEVCLTEC